MKKQRILILLTVICLLLPSLCSCREIIKYKEPEQQYLVAAMGFDGDGELISVSLEVIVFSVGEAESSIESKIFTGCGKTVRQAIGNLSGGISKNIVFTHCALIILGQSLTSAQLHEIFVFCAKKNDIGVSAMLTATPDAAELLSCQSISTPITGYDITGVLRQKSREWGLYLSCRLYEVESDRLNNNNFILPFFITEGDESKKYFLRGIRVYEDDQPVLTLDMSDSVLFCLLLGSYQSGTFFIESEGVVYQPSIKRFSSAVSADNEGEKQRIIIENRLILEEESSVTDIDALSRVLSGVATELYNTVLATCYSDIFKISKRTGPGYVDYRGADISIIFEIKNPQR